MIRIESNQTAYAEMLQCFAGILKGKIQNNILHLPACIGNGFLKLHMLPNGLQAIISNYAVKQDILFNRTKINTDFYTLRFDEVTLTGSISLENKSLLSAELSPVCSAGFLGNGQFDWMSLIAKGTKVKGVNILFTKEWLEQFSAAVNVGDIIKRYLSLKMSPFNYEPMDIEYKRILAEIVQTGADPLFETLLIQNRVMLLLERFFIRIFYKIQSSGF